MEPMKQADQWSSLGIMAFWWLCGDYVFSVLVKINTPPPAKTKQNKPNKKAIGLSSKTFCTPGPNFMMLAWTGDGLWCRQAQNGWICSLKWNFILKGKVDCSTKQLDLNPCLLHLWFKFDYPSLNGSRVIARASKWLTQGRTDRGRQRQYPKAKTALG